MHIISLRRFNFTIAHAKRHFKFRPGNRGEVFIWENFIPVEEVSVVETEISVAGLARLLIYEHIEIFTKEIGVRRDLVNRASQINRAHMKRALRWLDWVF